MVHFPASEHADHTTRAHPLECNHRPSVMQIGYARGYHELSRHRPLGRSRYSPLVVRQAVCLCIVTLVANVLICRDEVLPPWWRGMDGPLADRLRPPVRTLVSQCTRTARSFSRAPFMSSARRRRTQARAGQRCSTAEETCERAAGNLHRQFLGGSGAGRKDRFGDRGGGHVSGRMEHGGLPRPGRLSSKGSKASPINSTARFSWPLPTFPAPAKANHSLRQPQT